MAATKHEFFTTDTTTPSTNIYGANVWKAQTFTVGTVGVNENHTLTEIKLRLFRDGSPGTITVELQSVSGSPSEPTGSVHSTGTSDGDVITTSNSGEVVTFTMDSSFSIQASTQYAIVVKALDGDGANRVYWLRNSSGTYDSTTDCYHFTTNGGSTWGQTTGSDLNFEVWGDSGGGPSGWTGNVAGVSNPAKVHGIVVANISKVNGVS